MSNRQASFRFIDKEEDIKSVEEQKYVERDEAR